MAASYPSATKSFTTKTDGPSQTIFAAHVNDIQDEVVAIENDLRTRLPSGNVVFPAAQVTSSDANTLDDYEEGEWTPVLGGSGGTSGQSYTTQVGRYVKVGKLVWATFNVALSAKGTITTNCQIQGLPFTADNVTGLNPITSLYFVSLATNWIQVSAAVTPNTTTANVVGIAAAGASNNTNLTTADIGNTTQLIGTIVYQASQ